MSDSSNFSCWYFDFFYLFVVAVIDIESVQLIVLVKVVIKRFSINSKVLGTFYADL